MQVRTSFRPEFVNRVDDFVVFEALKKNEIKQIVRLQVQSPTPCLLIRAQLS